MITYNLSLNYGNKCTLSFQLLAKSRLRPLKFQVSAKYECSPPDLSQIWVCFHFKLIHCHPTPTPNSNNFWVVHIYLMCDSSASTGTGAPFTIRYNSCSNDFDYNILHESSLLTRQDFCHIMIISFRQHHLVRGSWSWDPWIIGSQSILL